ncbi:alpha/beta hydrolase [Streptomyces sp. ST2-7A]|uniref:alpha/beta hydrolase family protein n=1 Tax=Streptomyces sp. ST2-7A TaxID=2907214 RepID=UPI001F1AC1DF|nr:alpha/beta hydrolase [Streptomyces sp. ST2-7A]MCE7081655.1 alpha/beta hydrolase [Streptomyces sp. ST2-7A]
MEPHSNEAERTTGRHKRTSRRRILSLGVAALFAIGGAGVAVPAAMAGETAQTTDVSAQSQFQRGPNPTVSSIEARTGHYRTSTTRVSSFASGFGGGTIYYPTTTSDGTFGGVAVAPGYTASSSTMDWLGPRIASQGFVVFVIDTNTRLDQPSSRGRQLLAALDYLTERSSERHRVDSNRLAVMGHSMGGGGALEATISRPSLKASIPLTPWNLTKNWSRVTTPTLIVGAENDSVASVRSHSIPFYTSLSSSTDRMYVELDGASHFAPNVSNTTIAKYSISWLKRFVDDDTRYDQFLCPLPNERAISDIRGNCPR